MRQLSDKIGDQRLNAILERHLVDSALLAAEDFDAFYADRRARLHAWLVDRLERRV